MKPDRAKTKKRYSLKAEFTLLFFLLMVGTILAIWLANTFFLERFYLRDREEALNDAYAQLSTAASDGLLESDDFDAELAKLTSKDSISLIIMNQDSQALKYYASDLDVMMRRMWDNLLENTKELPDDLGPQEDAFADQNGAPNDFYIVRTLDTGNGQRCQIVLDRKTRTQYLEMWGSLSDGSYYLMRSAIESIAKSTETASNFILYIGIGIIATGAIIAFYLGNRITKPVLELTRISQRMKDLDFSAKYSGHDRTEIADLGQNINELSDILEHTIADLKTSNNELQADIERRDQLEKAQQEFISGVTHELKTPIAIIQGYAEGLEDGIADDPESQRFYLDTILEEAGKMNSMVQKMLTLTHLEFGNETVSFERFDIVEAITGYLQSARMLAENKGLEVCMDHYDPIYVWSDAFMAEEVFTNYFSNAVNHAESKIDVRITRHKDAVRVSVFNDGPNIPEESISHIWERFYKVDKARTRAYGGSGVGLSIVKAIMDLMHQDYGVINYDNGVEFWFELDASAGKI